MTEITRILTAIGKGDPRAASELLPLVYEELRKLAAKKLLHEKPGQTLQATALVHEAYLRLVTSNNDSSGERKPPKEPHWDSRGHFFAAAAEAMRRILIESARRKKSKRHGGGRPHRQLLIDDDVAAPPRDDDLLDLDEALGRLAAIDPKAAELVKLRVFAGVTVEEVADFQGLSPRTVKRNWAYARAWLGREMRKGDDSKP